MAAAALGAVACVVAPAPQAPAFRRLELLGRAVRARGSDPAAAAELAARAGPGAVLERYRLRLLRETLAASGADSAAWEALLSERLPAPAEREALVELGRALLREGRAADARSTLREASAAGSAEADLVLLGDPDPRVVRRAARRLAVEHPRRLRRAGLDLEAPVLAGLSPAEWLLRARSWREAGSPGTAARELGRLRWRGREESLRREEIARCWIAAGRPGRALRRLPPLSRSGPVALYLRAEAERRRAWGLVPRRTARRHFERARVAAAACLSRSSASPELRRRALEVLLETATETGRLEAAWSAWRELASRGWRGSRRGWLGRRLGVALARSGRWPGRVRALAAELPVHARCLRYWNARGAGRDGVLRELARTVPGDLYGRWAREELGEDPRPGLVLGPPVGRAPPPEPVRLLLSWGDPAGARRQWRELRSVRGTAPAEALAAAVLEAAGPRKGEAIRWLRRGVPCLGDPDLEGCPEDAVRAYLPLRWGDAVRAAAREAGLDPWLLAGVARQESVFDARARSPRGALGVVQLIPSTARRHGLALGLGPRPELHDPEVNLRLGARELAGLLRSFGAVEPALAAYNAGPTRARRWWTAWPDRRLFTESIPIPETYNYVRRVLHLSEAYRAVWGGNSAGDGVLPEGRRSSGAPAGGAG